MRVQLDELRRRLRPELLDEPLAVPDVERRRADAVADALERLHTLEREHVVVRVPLLHERHQFAEDTGVLTQVHLGLEQRLVRVQQIVALHDIASLLGPIARHVREWNSTPQFDRFA